ncbi:hypothetical protein FDC22_09685 [Clostridium botulinum]|uniref:Prepilin type IV endopeptidase peptidase domain-containing protein n=1 Tax=Clostridium botulinum TaxID=1491 RepID=A0A6G4FBX1_CLOBO|nr:hypothetical protein [Clostridium botulinum]
MVIKNIILFILTNIYLIILYKASLRDIKEIIVLNRTCLIEYILAFLIAILLKIPIKYILINSIWLFVIMYILQLVYGLMTDEIGIGGGDIKLAPAITLFIYPYSYIGILIGLLLSVLDPYIFKRKNKECPFVIYYFLSCIIAIIARVFHVI